jgi:hypothetical protein
MPCRITSTTSKISSLRNPGAHYWNEKYGTMPSNSPRTQKCQTARYTWCHGVNKLSSMHTSTNTYWPAAFDPPNPQWHLHASSSKRRTENYVSSRITTSSTRWQLKTGTHSHSFQNWSKNYVVMRPRAGWGSFNHPLAYPYDALTGRAPYIKAGHRKLSSWHFGLVAEGPAFRLSQGSHSTLFYQLGFLLLCSLMPPLRFPSLVSLFFPSYVSLSVATVATQWQPPSIYPIP